MTDATEVRERIEEILAAAPEIAHVIVDEECPLLDAEIPAIHVVTRGGNRDSSSRDRRVVTRTFEIKLFADEVCDTSPAELDRVYKLTEALLELVPTIIDASREKLHLEDTGLVGVQSMGEMTDQGPKYMLWGGKTHGVIVYQLPVTFRR